MYFVTLQFIKYKGLTQTRFGPFITYFFLSRYFNIDKVTNFCNFVAQGRYFCTNSDHLSPISELVNGTPIFSRQIQLGFFANSRYNAFVIRLPTKSTLANLV